MGRNQHFEDEEDDEDEHDEGEYENDASELRKKEHSTSAEIRVLSNFLQPE
jgi:hypothetical protein